jgi:putative mRNA 3-end processing factor
VSLLRFSKYGIYCPKGDFYIDASGKVERNIVTHAHSDHARPGHISYLAHKSSKPLLTARLGKKANIQALEYGTALSMNGVKVSLHPSGHIYGAAQVRVENEGEVWVVSGDYKLEDDHLSVPFEAIKCHNFVTECTFGLPVYCWPDQDEVYEKINNWWRQNTSEGITSILYGYSLGKSQRIIKNIDHGIGPVFVHRTVGTMNDAIIADGGDLPVTTTLTENMDAQMIQGNLIIAPPSFTSGPMVRGLAPFSVAMASGWIQSGRNMGSLDFGFVLSDHADWNGLLTAIKATGAGRVITMHGYTRELTRWLNENGTNSIEIGDLKHQPYQL